MSSVLDSYRDDGAITGALARAARGPLASAPAAPVLLTLAGALPLVLVLLDRGAVDGWPLPVAVAWYVLTAGAAAGRSHVSKLDWVIPPLLRAVEYFTLARVVAVVDPAAQPAAYALLAALAFHHYDTVYRLRHRRVAPPTWLRLAGGGWDVRLLLACLLVGVGGLGMGAAVAAAVLGVLYVGESTAGWLRPNREGRDARTARAAAREGSTAAEGSGEHDEGDA
ncbi:DUF5941 domain-containing protein [Motilibacter deserti]|uniref:DUF5941 domain-containing protein n=1 Tax=Motilibacter deserti TaxID=2714956 RepID=A0ABX0H137_9ACTN|nr:hypothetical protein [Motilibacter deserti]